ncbi:BspA family leucine-rich repeat surface protein [Ichthyobacterium seriolicida]|uniref:PKD domain-containing protein n=1 Tax=Ichthyobacterium seriolicida TaxID=242600 RepID=A0A1J1E341_9FLAO|nr:BspA family leucine-rich repeat surface protein [Ichthyobacterium seriolicida]BAV94452.1 hypothetical protein JBKA6_0439 [Ichthyobacterium seriolicida]
MQGTKHKIFSIIPNSALLLFASLFFLFTSCKKEQTISDTSDNTGLTDTSDNTGLKKFITKWEITDGNKTIKLPIYSGGTYKFDVDWGDGIKQEVTSHDDLDASHTYAVAGEKTVTITGKIEGFNFGKVSDSKDKILEISDWGELKLGNSVEYTGKDGNNNDITVNLGCFQECTKLVTLPSESPNLEKVTNMVSMFAGATSFNGDISKWNVSNVTNMTLMFAGATSFNGDISKWNVSNVTDMTGMFGGATSFNGDISKWNVSNVTNMVSMFAGATSFNGDISKWNVSNVTNMASMFATTTSFNGDISKWNVSNVTGMATMFTGATSFNQNIGSWNISNVTDTFLMMFHEASAFCQDLSSWKVPSGTSIELMFQDSGMPYSDSLSDKSKHPTEKSE